ncbi:MAG: histidine phosphatase family protein [Lachnospiraceae bacterium]|nr:histidine phosphatase family protein [Lachnospiraceae bacterium]
MQILMIRHGKTSGNAHMRYIGRTDEPLSQAGISQLQALGQDPLVRSVFVSPLKRTCQTASLLFPNARQIIINDLQEMDFGDFEGRSFREMTHDTAYRAWVDSDCLAPCPGGESREVFSQRVCGAFSRILSQAQARKEQRIVLVVHGGTIMAIMEHFALPRKDFYTYSVKNGTGYICDTAADSQGSFVLTDIIPWERHL